MNDTIVAIASSMTNSGIGIIRISGPDAIKIADKIFHGKNKLKDCESHTIQYGHIFDQDKKIDEVMVLLFRGPRSYTTEDVIEIDCHGGSFILNQILSLVINNGARLAEPGEFTKRAFFGGRIDLSQAESVMDLISSKNEFARKSSMNQLSGALSNKIKEMRAVVIHELAFIEAALDDPEHYDLDGYPDKLEKTLNPIIENIDYMINTSDFGIQLKEGIQTAIIGKPNAGKSSLLNALMRQDRAIVTDIAGTTRDVLQETIQIEGLSLNLMDTAGIRETEDLIEQIGVKKAFEAVEFADLVLYVIDASIDLSNKDKEMLSMLSNKKTIVLLNKADLKQVLNEDEILKYNNAPVISISAKDLSGISDLEKKIVSLFYKGEISLNDEFMITNLRHKEALMNAKNSLSLVIESINSFMPEDMFAVDLMDAYKYLGFITGESVSDDLVDEIFSKFCMGK